MAIWDENEDMDGEMLVLMIGWWWWVWMFGADVIYDKNECGCIGEEKIYDWFKYLLLTTTIIQYCININKKWFILNITTINNVHPSDHIHHPSTIYNIQLTLHLQKPTLSTLLILISFHSFYFHLLYQ